MAMQQTATRMMLDVTDAPGTPGGVSVDHSTPISVDGNNKVTLELLVWQVTTNAFPTVTCLFEGSNDLQTWTKVSTAKAEFIFGTTSLAPQRQTSTQGIDAYDYIRVRSTITGAAGARAVVSVGVGLSRA